MNDVSQGIQQFNTINQSPRIQSIKKQFTSQQIKFFYESQVFQKESRRQQSPIQKYVPLPQYGSYLVDQNKSLRIPGVKILKVERPRSPITFEPTREKMKVYVKYTDPSAEQQIQKQLGMNHNNINKGIQEDAFSFKIQWNRFLVIFCKLLFNPWKINKQMKSIFSKLKNVTKSLFSSNKEETTQVEQKVSTIEEQLNALNDQNLKARIIQNRDVFYQLIVDLTWPKILELRISYALERRKNFQPRLVLQEQSHCEKIIIQYCQEVLSHYNLQGLIYYNDSEVIKMVNMRVIQEQCQKILFSKEELRDYFEFYRDAQEYVKEIRKLDYSVQAMKLIEKQYLIDLGYEKFKIDECDEKKAISLFRDDEEVNRWYANKCQYVQE